MDQIRLSKGLAIAAVAAALLLGLIVGGALDIGKSLFGGSNPETVASSAFDAADQFGWVACDNRITRAVAKVFREEYKIPRKSIKAQAYWVA